MFQTRAALKAIARAQRVSEGALSKILMCAFENSYDRETNNMEGDISK